LRQAIREDQRRMEHSGGTMSEPTGQQIARFLKAFDELARFDAMLTLTRGMSAHRAADWPEKPDQDVVAVRTWLGHLASTPLAQTGG
jgi:hypothetical protein